MLYLSRCNTLHFISPDYYCLFKKFTGVSGFLLKRCCATGMAVLFVFVHNVYAQTDKDSAQVLKNVEVTARLFTAELTPVQRMDAKTIMQLSSSSVADAVRYFSGVQIKDYGGVGGLKTVNIRSMGTNHLGVFYDGIQLGNAQNGQVDLGRFSLDNMEEIVLYNGQKPELLQPAKDFGAAGSIYLQSAVPKFETDKKTNLRIGFKSGSFGLINPAITWQQKLTEKISSSFSTEWTHAHGRYKFRYRKLNNDGSVAYDTSAIRQNGDINALRIEGGLNGIIPNGDWKFKAYTYLSERGLPGFIANNVFKHGQRQWDKNLFAQGTFRKKIAPWYSVLMSGKFAYDYTRYLDDDPASMYTNNKYRQKETYISAANEFSLTPIWKIAFSGDYQWNSLDANLVQFAYPERHTALFALASSLRLERLKLQASMLGTYVEDHVKLKNAAPPKTEYTPAIFASYQPFKSNDFIVRAFYKKIFRMPTFNDLYYTFIGNAVLKPEFATQYDLGFTYTKTIAAGSLKQISLQTDAYYNEVTDKIVAVPTSNPFRWMMLNLGMVEIRGIDLAVKANWQLKEALTLSTRLTYTYQKAQDFTDHTDTYYGDQIPYTPWNSCSAILNAAYKKWDLNYSFIYTGERYDQKANIAKNHVEPWYTSDLSLSRGLGYGAAKLRISAEVNNLFNQYYDVVLNYPMPGRNYKLILQFSL